jgi:uncharacterized membrane protein
MTTEKMISDLAIFWPFFLNFILSIFGIIFVIGGIRNFTKLTHFLHIIEVPVGVIGVIIGSVLMYYGNTFSVLWRIIKWVSLLVW